jgi:hypothetical protein
MRGAPRANIHVIIAAAEFNCHDMETHSMKKKHITVRNAALASVLAVTATAWAASEVFTVPTQSTIVPIEDKVLNPAPPTAAPEVTLEKNETVVVPDEAPPMVRERPAPAIEPVAAPAEPPITIEQKRMTLDERIQSEVMDRLANAQDISGRIGVESHEAVVTLTGYTTTSGQAYRAERAARGVEGVRYVDNRIRARVGGSI